MIQVNHCEVCQKSKRKFDKPAAPLHPIPVSDANWLDRAIPAISWIMGSGDTATAARQELLADVDQFSKVGMFSTAG